MDTTHRRIELQSPADLLYLRSNASRAARQKIDLHFPPSAAPELGEDAMRKRVEELVDEYLAKTFRMAGQSVEVNGLEAAELEGLGGKEGEGEGEFF